MSIPPYAMASHQTLLLVETVAVKVVLVIVELTKNVMPVADGVSSTAEGMTPRLCVMVVPPVVMAEKPNAIRVSVPCVSTIDATPRCPAPSVVIAVSEA